jgi:hypothetical protein
MHTPSCTLPANIPIDVDCTWTLKPLAQTCYYCGQSRHISKGCDIHHDVSHMMLEEQDEFIQHIMANCNTAVAAAAELMTQMSTSEGTLVDREVNDMDFVSE